MAYLLWRRRLPWSWALDGCARRLCPGGGALSSYSCCVTAVRRPRHRRSSRLISDGARAAGWTALPRKSFAGYVGLFRRRLPRRMDADTQRPRSVLNYTMLAIPVAAAHLCAGGNRRCRFAACGGTRRRRSMSSSCVARWRLPQTFVIACHLQLWPLRRDRVADGRLPALLLAADRDRATRRAIAHRRDRSAALAQCLARVLDCRTGRVPAARRAARLSARHSSNFRLHRKSS